MEVCDKSLKKIELDMLVALDEVCKKINVTYFLAEGTLLGAIRHKGFIPWDDDIDVCMLRKDYEKFLSIGQQYLPAEIFIQTYDTDQEYSLGFCKLRNTDTTYIETSASRQEINHGIFIDIFPVDYYPENRIKAAILEFKRKFLTYRITDAFYFSEVPKYSFVGRLLRTLSRIAYPSARTALIKRDKLFKSVKESSLVCNYGSTWGKKEIMSYKVYHDSMDVEFEGHKLKAPIEADQYLRNLYGDYMELPPVEKRVGHHDAVIIDTEKPYVEYKEKYGHSIVS